MSTASTHSRENEVTILARFLGDRDGHLPKDVARYILDLHVSERDKARMHNFLIEQGEFPPAWTKLTTSRLRSDPFEATRGRLRTDRGRQPAEPERGAFPRK